MNMPDMPGMAGGGAEMAGGEHPEQESGVRFSGQEWSIFNHRGAGLFLLLWGATALIAGWQWPRKTWWRFVPPVVLFGLVEFLVIRNDPEAWPVGPIGLWSSLRDREVFQHRVFVLLLLAIAIVELLRACDKLPRFLEVYSLPALAVAGGVYLFFHQHGGAAMAQMMQHMSDASASSAPGMKSMMDSMALVKHEHMWFSISGFGLAAAKLLADAGRLKGRLGAILWTPFAIALGVYMLGYLE